MRTAKSLQIREFVFKHPPGDIYDLYHVRSSFKRSRLAPAHHSPSFPVPGLSVRVSATFLHDVLRERWCFPVSIKSKVCQDVKIFFSTATRLVHHKHHSQAPTEKWKRESEAHVPKEGGLEPHDGLEVHERVLHAIEPRFAQCVLTWSAERSISDIVRLFVCAVHSACLTGLDT